MDIFSYVRWTFFPPHWKFDGPIFRGPIFLVDVFTVAFFSVDHFSMDIFSVDVFTEYLTNNCGSKWWLLVLRRARLIIPPLHQLLTLARQADHHKLFRWLNICWMSWYSANVNTKLQRMKLIYGIAHPLLWCGMCKYQRELHLLTKFRRFVCVSGQMFCNNLNEESKIFGS